MIKYESHKYIRTLSGFEFFLLLQIKTYLTIYSRNTLDSLLMLKKITASRYAVPENRRERSLYQYLQHFFAIMYRLHSDP